MVQEEITVNKNVFLTCIGGDSNQSGSGGRGGDGGVGQGARNPSGPLKLNTYKGGDGGDGARGGSGAAEARPGAAVVCSKITINSAAKVTCQRGKRGAPGKAGIGGKGALGGFGSEGSVTDWDGAERERAPAGKKGEDGKPGKILNHNEIFDYIISVVNGKIITTT